MNLFVDSSGWIALFDSNDKYYQLASKAMTSLQGEIVNLLTSDYVVESVWQAAWEMFQAYEDKEWAFTDCTSFVLMHQHHLWQTFSFDQHFVQAGFQLWPALPTN